jgi:hypothetical protein
MWFMYIQAITLFIALQKQLSVIASHIKEIFITDSTNCISKAKLYTGNNNNDRISEEVNISVDG